MLRHDLNGVGDDQVPMVPALMPSPLNMPSYGTPGYVPGATYILPGSAYSLSTRAVAPYGDVKEANIGKDSYVAEELNGCECDGSGYGGGIDTGKEYGVGGSGMFTGMGDDSRYRGEVDRYTDMSGVGEDFGPVAPTGTQLAVQEVRDIVTSDIKIPSTFSTSTIIYAVGGLALAYLAYNYWYGRATA